MFNNVGGKLRVYSWIVFIIGSVWSLFLAIVCFVLASAMNYASSFAFGSGGGGGIFIVLGIFTLLFGVALSYLLALLVCGFGQIVRNTNILAGQDDRNPALFSALKTANDPYANNAGVAYGQPQQPMQPQQPIQPTPAPARAVKYCGQCGAENDPDYAFCLKCGSRLD